MVQGQRIGLSGLSELFVRWADAGRRAADLGVDEVLAALREKNYVSRSVEGQYFEAARAAYARWESLGRRRVDSMRKGV